MTKHIKKTAQPKPVADLPIATTISKKQFLKLPTHFIYRVRKGESFYVEGNGDDFLIYPILKQ